MGVAGSAGIRLVNGFSDLTVEVWGRPARGLGPRGGIVAAQRPVIVDAMVAVA